MNYKKSFFATLGILIAFIFAFILIPLFCGYSLGFLNGYSWEADNIITLLGIIVATGTAIYIPRKIADRQNKIDLFEKRYDILNEFINLNTIGCRAILGNEKAKEKFKINFETFNLRQITYLFNKDIHMECYQIIYQIRSQLDLLPTLNLIEEELVFLGGHLLTNEDLLVEIDFYKTCEKMKSYLNFERS